MLPRLHSQDVIEMPFWTPDTSSAQLKLLKMVRLGDKELESTVSDALLMDAPGPEYSNM